MRHVYVCLVDTDPMSFHDIASWEISGVFSTLKKARANRPDACGHDELRRYPVDRLGKSKQMSWTPEGRA